VASAPLLELGARPSECRLPRIELPTATTCCSPPHHTARFAWIFSFTVLWIGLLPTGGCMLLLLRISQRPRRPPHTTGPPDPPGWETTSYAASVGGNTVSITASHGLWKAVFNDGTSKYVSHYQDWSAAQASELPFSRVQVGGRRSHTSMHTKVDACAWQDACSGVCRALSEAGPTERTCGSI
jgi:hypothetical protein